jgi:hypothetical protein
VSYDIPVALNPITVKDESGAAKAWSTVSVANGTTYYGTTTTGSLTGLFPWPAGYAVYAGDCRGNDPANFDPTFSTTPAFVSAYPAPAAGTTAAATAFLHTMTWTVKNTAASPRFSVHYDTTAGSPMVRPVGETPQCSDTKLAPLSTPATMATGTTTKTLDLPHGVYKVCFDNGLSNASSRKYEKLYNFTTATSGTYKANPPAATIDLTGGAVAIDGATVQVGSVSTTVKCA